MIASPIRIRFPTCRSRPFDFPYVPGLRSYRVEPSGNASLFDRLASNANDDAAHRELIDAVNDYTRMRMREDGFYRHIMPPVLIPNAELDRAVPTDLPVRIGDSQ